MTKDIQSSAHEKLLGLTIDIIHQPGRWEELCDVVCDVYGANAFMVFEFDFKSFAAPIFRGYKNHEDALQLIQAHMEGRVPDEERRGYARFAAFPSGMLIGEYQCYDLEHDRDLPENPFRDAVLSVSGSQSRSVMRLNDIGPWSDIAALHMPIPFAEVDPQLKQDAASFLPLIGKAMEAARTLSGLARLNDALTAAFDKFDFGAAIFRPSGQMIVCNAEFKSIAAERDGLELSGGFIRATLRDDVGPLAKAMRSVHDTQSLPNSSICRLRRRSQRLPLIARAIPIRGHEIGVQAEALSLLLVIDPEAPDRVNVDGVSALGILSQAELDICDLIVTGKATQEIADHRGTSVQTVTDQVKSALAKLACGSRIDIVRLAMATRPPGRR